jgi:hypothetical protein
MTLSYPSWAVGLRCNEKQQGICIAGNSSGKKELLGKGFIPSSMIDGMKIPKLNVFFLPL